MMEIKAVSLTSVLAIGLCCLPGAAGAGDATFAAEFQRRDALAAAQSTLGYPVVANLNQVGCCCPTAPVSNRGYTNLDQQIAALSAALKQPPKPVELSPAMLAEGAY